MPITSSAKKALKRSKKQHEVNLKFKIEMKKSIKDIKKAVSETKGDHSELVRKAYQAIDKAQKKNIIHKNNAARKKSLVTKLAGKWPSVATTPKTNKVSKPTKSTSKKK